MSKGNMFWNLAKGKVGSIVVSVRNGEVITRQYQPNVANPRSDSQMLQRAKFANSVKFYRNATANFFKFAYEDKKKNESDFNAFMRHNTTKKSAVLLHSQVKGTFPALGQNWELTHGSLVSPIVAGVIDSIPVLECASVDENTTTVAALSRCLVADYGLVEGDIFTFVRVHSNVKSLSDANPEAQAIWNVFQFVLSFNDATPLKSVCPLFVPVPGSGLKLDEHKEAVAVGYSVVFSRKTKGAQLKVSRSMLINNAAASSLYNSTLSDDWTKKALISWKAAGKAVLEGDLAETVEVAVISSINDNELPYLSNTTFDLGIVSSAKIKGENLSKLSTANFTGKGVRVRSIAIAGNEATITIEGTGDFPLAWSLSYLGEVIAMHTEVDAVISTAVPTSVDVIDPSDHIEVRLAGVNLYALKKEKFTSNNEHLTVEQISVASDSSAVVKITATQRVTSAELSYNGKKIFEVAEKTATIEKVNGVAVGQIGFDETPSASNITLNLEGQNLDILAKESFTASAGYIVSYTATSATQAAVVINQNNSESMTVRYANTIIYKFGSTESLD